MKASTDWSEPQKEGGFVNSKLGTLRHVVAIGLTWGILWLAFWVIVGVVIGIVVPDSIDPGEGPMIVTIFGPMGLLSGIVFGTLLSIGSRGRAVIDHSVLRNAGWGMLGSAIVQSAYLGHGDQGLAANIRMALLFSVIGGLITVVWVLMARRWWHRRRVSTG